MGSGASKSRPVRKQVHFDVEGEKISVEFLSSCTSEELKDLLASAAGFSSYNAVTVKNNEGFLIPLNSSLPVNSASTSYQVTVVCERRNDTLLESLREELRSEFCNNDMVEEFASKFSLRLNALEKKLEDGDSSESEDELEPLMISSAERALQLEQVVKSEPKEAHGSEAHGSEAHGSWQQEDEALKSEQESVSSQEAAKSVQEEATKTERPEEAEPAPGAVTTKQPTKDLEATQEVELSAKSESPNEESIMPQEATKSEPAPESVKPLSEGADLQLPPFGHIASQETAESLKCAHFNMWTYDGKEMVHLIEFMYHNLGLIEELKISPLTLRKCLHTVRENYRDNPFHNFRHAFCVTQMMYAMLHICDLNIVFSKLEMALLLTAAASHDLDHPGLSNSYQTNAQTELGMKYSQSPLENHHFEVAFQILEQPETNIFASLSQEEFSIIKQDTKDLILSTDLKEHARTSEDFGRIVDEGIDYNKKEHKKQLMMMLLKCCDISNEVRPLEISGRWLDCLLEEYFQQSDAEKREGLPYCDFMDRDKTTKSTSQVGFITYMLLPTFELMTKVYPSLEKTMIVPLWESLAYYEQLGETELAEKSDEPCGENLTVSPIAD